MQTSTVSAKAIRTYALLATLLFSTLTSFAHRVEVYSSTGCFAGNTITVAGVVAYAPSNTYYNWQYKDASGIWKCFTASTVINGSTFAVTNYQGGPASNLAPTLSIASATSVLENVQVRLIMSEDVRPCGAPAGTLIWGGDDQNIQESKFYRIHIYGSTADCGGNTPGCLGNFLSSGSGMSNYYGGFESMVYNSANSTFTNNNFISGAGSSAYTEGGNNSTAPATSGSGTFQVLNNPYGVNHSNGQFAPHSGNFQMVIDGAANTQKLAWYKTVTVVPGTIYNFSTWVARTQGSNAFNIKLTVNGTDVATSAVGTSVGIWSQVAGSYTVPAGVTSIQISISDVSTAAERYFSLDDICFAKTSALMDLGNRVFYDTNNNGINDGENGIQGVTVHLYLDANNDNVADGAAIATDVTDVDGFYDFPNLAQGNYIVGIVTPAGYMSSSVNGGDPDNNIDLDDNGQVIMGNEIRGLAITLSMEAEPGGNTNGTYDFGLLPDCTCTTSTGNLLVNGSFENGTTGWTASGGTLTTGTGYIACGSANGFNNWSAGTSNVYQDVTTMGGAVLTFKGFAGTHTPGISCSPKLSLIFLNSAGTVLSQVSVNVTRDVDVNHSQLEQYTLTGTAPAGATKVRVQSSIICNTMKLDAFCLTAVNPTYTLGNTVWNDTNNNGIQETGEPGLQGAIVKLYDCSGNYLNQTVTTNTSGNYLFTALPAGSYIVGVTPPTGYAKSDIGATNVATDNQNDGVTVVGSEIRTACFTTTGSTNNIDFGLKGTGAIGDYVWNDANGNGIQDANEVGLSGVSVQLKNSAGTVIATTTSNAVGYYQFTNLSPGTYTVQFLAVAGFGVSPANVGTNDAIDSDVDGTGSVTVTLAAGESNQTIDAGFCPTTLCIGNLIFKDANNNGLKDASETGISGVTVNIYQDANNDNVADGASFASVTTGTGGTYSFCNLIPGNYIIGVVKPAGYSYSLINGGDPDNNIDNDNNGITIIGTEIRGNAITLSGGAEPDGTGATNTNTNNTYDFGFVPNTGSIGDFVWNDTNGNGIQDSGEPGINGVTVTLTGTGFTTQTTTTTGNGAYSFTNLSPGTYTVTFTTPAGYTPTTANVPSDDTKDSDPVNGAGVAVTLTAGQTDNTIDAGYYTLLSIGNTVWNDRNNNGIQDPNEPGIPGVVVKLYDCAGNYLNKTFTTDANGNYTLAGVAPGSYIVGITTPAGYAKGDVGTTDVTTDNKNDGTVATATEVRTTCFPITTTTTNIDFGLKGTGSIGDFVWNDTNGNGIQDPGEPGINGATVTLTYPGGATLVTTTNASGIYTFSNLAPGTYSVTFTTPAGLNISPSNVTTTGATDLNDSDPVGGVVSGIVLTAGQSNTTIDAGFYSCLPLNSGINGPATICANEPALFTATPAGTGSVYTWTFMSGTPATFTGPSATPKWTTPGEYDITLTVTKNGCTSTYLKSIIITQAVYAAAGPDADICQGSSVTLNGSGPAGANFSWTVIAGDPTSIDNGASQMAVLVSPLQTTSYQLTVTQNGCSRTDTVVVNINVNKNPTADAGPDRVILINTPVTIGGSPTGTPPIAAPTAPLGYTWSPATNLNSSTVANPSATFTAVGVYNYRVIVYSTLTGCSDSDYVAITAVQPVSVGNTVWNDINNNGIKDANETGVGGVTVKLYMDADNNNVADGAAIATTTTNSSGAYAFTNLYPSNNYIVGITIPSGYTSVATNGGDPDNNIDNDNNGTNLSVAGEIRSNAITLTAGGEPATAVDGDDTNGNQTLDFALRGTASLGDRVFRDLNRNGIQDAGEIGISGATVTLTYANGATVSTTTNASGIYGFSNLAPGTYSVTFTNPGGAYVPTLSNVTTTGATDLNDSDPINGVVSGIILTAGQNNTSVDAGFYQTISINGHVWNDVNGLTNNEINNTPGAAPIPQFLNVYLVDANTNLIVQAETVNPNGTYSFQDVDINTSYVIVVSTVNSFPGLPLPRPVLPAGWIRVGENLGAGPNSGSDGIIDGQLYIDTDTTDVFDANFGIQNRNGEIVIG